MRGCSLAALIAFLPGIAQAQVGTARATFERHNLLGIFGWDCSKPPSKQNHYFVHRALDSGQVQRDMMDGPSSRGWIVMIDNAANLKRNEIFVSGTRDGRPFTSIYRVEADRMLVVESTVDGKVEVTGGRVANGGPEVPWAHRCSGL